MKFVIAFIVACPFFVLGWFGLLLIFLAVKIQSRSLWNLGKLSLNICLPAIDYLDGFLDSENYDGSFGGYYLDHMP